MQKFVEKHIAKEIKELWRMEKEDKKTKHVDSFTTSKETIQRLKKLYKNKFQFNFIYMQH
jgi:hypothetical protein